MSIENDLRELARTYSTQLKNQINTIHEGDCLEVLDSIEKGSIDLAYLDPLFLRRKNMILKLVTELRNSGLMIYGVRIRRIADFFLNV